MPTLKSKLERKEYTFYGRLAYHFGIEILEYIRECNNKYLSPRQIGYMLDGARKERSINKIDIAEGVGIVNSKKPKREFERAVKELEKDQ